MDSSQNQTGPNMNQQVVQDICYSLLRRASHDRIVIGTTKLVKLLYLIDCEYFRWHGKTLTEAPWIFYHFGPYAEELVTVAHQTFGIEALPKEEFEEKKFYRGYRITSWRPDPIEEAHFSIRSVVEAVYQRWAGVDLELLLDHVYFETPPMLQAKRFEALDFSLIPSAQRRMCPPEQARDFSTLIPTNRQEALRTKLKANVTRHPVIRKPLSVPIDETTQAALEQMGARD
jgi:uncharacterized phage-associated protein